jgi:site-specific DNA-methyltransferase (adenine-specific)
MEGYMMDLNNLYLMDCMEGMAQFPDKYFELAIVDPPYGVGSITYTPGVRQYALGGFIDKYDVTMAVINMEQRASVKSKRLTGVVRSDCTAKTIKNFGDENISPAPDYFKELFRVSKNQIIWGGNYFMLPPSRGFVIWRKTTVQENFSMAMCEFAWLSFNENAKWFACAPQGTTRDPRIHPTQKPVALYRWLLNTYAKPGDKILDTHAGSASSFVAAYDLGFDYIGFEIDPEYHAAALKRVQTIQARGRISDFLEVEA